MAKVNCSDFVIGVDPGLGGALALFDARPGSEGGHKVFDMPTLHNKGSKLAVDAQELANLVGEMLFDLPEGATIEAAVENVGSRPRQAGAFNFGLSTGIIHGVLATHGVKFHLVSPAQWKGAMGLHRKPEETQDETKDRARAVASKLFPTLVKSFGRKKDDGRAEALLLAVFYAHKARQ